MNPDVTIEQSFVVGAGLFNTGSFWEAHEAWEHGWRVSQEPVTTLYKGLIQTAAALVHWQRGNTRGLERNWYKARPKLVAVISLTQLCDIASLITTMDQFVLSHGLVAVLPQLFRPSVPVAT